MHHHSRRALVGATLLGLGLTACGSDGSGSAPASAPTTSTPTSDGLTLRNGWAKAADHGMTAVFGTLRNDTDTPIVLTAVSSDVAERSEFHVTRKDSAGQMAMKPVKTFTVPANGSFPLKPGANHLMLLDLKKPLKTGAEVTVSLDRRRGGRVDLTVPVRSFAGAEESYEPHSDHGAS